MSWFNEVTGSNEFERQSWRDSFNSGRAAGDLTGNVNRRLDAERAAFQGATWSGSSTRYSALELAQRRHGVGAPASGGGSPSAGPGNPVVTQGPVIPGRPAGGSGAGSRLVVWGGWGSVNPRSVALPWLHEPLPLNEIKATPLYFDGVPLDLDFGTSDGGDYEQRWGEWGGGIAGLGVMARDGWNAGANWFAREGQAFQRNWDRAVRETWRPGQGGGGW